MAVFSAAKKARLDVSPQTVQITFMTLLYHPEFACATLLFSPNHVTFYSNLTDVEVMMPPTSEALQSTDPASPKTPALPEGSDRDYFNSPQPLNDGWTCSCGNIWQASVSCDNRDWVNEGRKVGRSRNTHGDVQTDHRWWQMKWRGEGRRVGVGGIVKEIAVQSAALTIWCQPLAGEMWQAGRWAAAVCVADWEIRADMQRFPQPRLQVLKLMIATQAAVTRELTVARTNIHVCAHTLSVGVKLHRLLLITATVPAFRAGSPNYTAQPQQGRCAQQSFVRLIICLGLVIAVRTGTQVIVW